MPSIGSLLEAAVIADLRNDSVLGQYLIQAHDFQPPASSAELTDQQKNFQVRVTAEDGGDMAVGSDSFSGCGIRRVHLSVDINGQMFAPNYPATMDEIEGRVSDRLQPSSSISGVQGREDAFATIDLKIFGILSDQPTLRHDHDANQIRQRTVQRTFIAAQLA